MPLAEAYPGREKRRDALPRALSQEGCAAPTPSGRRGRTGRDKDSAPGARCRGEGRREGERGVKTSPKAQLSKEPVQG